MPLHYTAEKLYSLLPAIYQLRDQEQGGALRALIEVIAEQSEHVEADIEQLYENWFIETAAEWVIPYIGDLLGVHPLNPASAAVFSQRAWVANTIRYRRRKGTATVLEQLARDVTGWNARAVEFFQLLGTTQNLNHLRPKNLRTPALRQPPRWLNTPFDTAAHTVEVRRIATGRGRYNIPNVGLFLWRLESYPLSDVTAFEVGTRRYSFSPLGLNTALFNNPQSESTITHLAEPENVPMPIGRWLLREQFDSLFGAQKALTLHVEPAAAFAGAQFVICNLQDDGAGWAFQPQNEIALDPELGRIAFPTTLPVPTSVVVGYSYGFSGDIGGGPYDRADSVAVQFERPVGWNIDWRVEIIPGQPASPDEHYPTLADAIRAWNALPENREGIIVLQDSQTYSLANAPHVVLKQGSRLMIAAATYPDDYRFGGVNYAARTFDQLRFAGVRPLIRGQLGVRGDATNAEVPGGFALNGVLLNRPLSVRNGNLGTLQIAHASLPPGMSGIEVVGENESLHIYIERSIVGAVLLPSSVPNLTLTESIFQGDGAGLAIDASGAVIAMESCTVFAPVTARSITASNSIFMQSLQVERRQLGCLRFCYLGDLAGSRVPRRYRCQPDLLLAARTRELNLESPDDLPPNEQIAILNRLIPKFSSQRYGDADYAQLSLATALEIREGAEDSAEIGVFRFLKQPQREENLRASLDQYLKTGLEAGISFVT